ncbi:MAG: SDR family NAD(P)-dependent oxidoreductase, partial [Telluria sp.]
MNLDKKTAVVTGAAGGIGLAIARRLLADGASVVLADLNEERLATASADLAKDADPARIAVVRCDVSVEADVVHAVDTAVQQFGGIDIVVNNAGLMVFKPIEEQTGEDWTRILNVDLVGAFYFTKQAFLRMKNGGAIVNIASVHAIETEPMVASYAAAKAALLSLTRSASLEGKPKGIRVNAVLPGAIDTPMLWDNPNVRAGIEVVAKADVGQPDDVAAVVAFL